MRAFSIASGSYTVTFAPCSWIRPAMSSAGESRTSSVPALNAAPSTVTFLPIHSAPSSSWVSVDDPGAAVLVDVVDLAQQRDDLFDTELAGAGHERAQILRQAAAAVPGPGVQHAAADPLVVPERVGQLGDVRAGRVGHLGERVDEGDLRGQEGVRAALDQLRGRQVADDHRRYLRRSAAANTSRSRASAAADWTPNTRRSGCSVSSTPCASRRNSGCQAISTASPGRGLGVEALLDQPSTYRPGRWTGRPPGSAGSAAGRACRRRSSPGTGRRRRCPRAAGSPRR